MKKLRDYQVNLLRNAIEKTSEGVGQAWRDDLQEVLSQVIEQQTFLEGMLLSDGSVIDAWSMVADWLGRPRVWVKTQALGWFYNRRTTEPAPATPAEIEVAAEPATLLCPEAILQRMDAVVASLPKPQRVEVFKLEFDSSGATARRDVLYEGELQCYGQESYPSPQGALFAMVAVVRRDGDGTLESRPVNRVRLL